MTRPPIVFDFGQDMQPRGACDQCPWETGPSSKGKDRALQHAAVRGHRVRVITERIEYYQPADPDE